MFRSDSQADGFRQPNADARFTTNCYAEAQHLGRLLDRQQYALAAAGCSRSVPLPGILPEGRAAIPPPGASWPPLGGLHLTYTPRGIILDHLTQVQRIILAHLDIPLPWPEKPA